MKKKKEETHINILTSNRLTFIAFSDKFTVHPFLFLTFLLIFCQNTYVREKRQYANDKYNRFAKKFVLIVITGNANIGVMPKLRAKDITGHSIHVEE
jgi:hypothetical protein